jgi:hypothetical protein
MKLIAILLLTLCASSAFAAPGHDSFDVNGDGVYACYPVDYYGRRLSTTPTQTYLCHARYQSFDVNWDGSYGCYSVDQHGRRLSHQTVSYRYCQTYGDDGYEQPRRPQRRPHRGHERHCREDEFGIRFPNRCL